MSAPSDVVQLTTDLVAVDSVNPSLVPGGAGEGRIAAAVVDWASRSGLTAEVVEETPGRPSVVVRSGPRGGGRTLLLCGHLDTVGHGAMRSPLTPRLEGDRLYGRGAYDMKGGLAAALVACRDAAAAGVAGEVVVAAVADEEHASLGVREVLAHVQADAAVVTEPTELEVVTAHKGFAWIEIEVTGRAAHGSRPHLGVDAIRKTGPVLVALDAWDRALAAGTHHDLLGAATVHASLIEGGTEASTIPDRCLLTAERRTLPGETAEQVGREVEDLLRRCRADDPELAVGSRLTLVRDPFETPADAPLVTELTAAAGTVLGRTAAPTGASYWADSAFLSAAGIPTALFGPGGEGAHADVEWVNLRDVEACAAVLTRLAVAFCR